MSEPHHEAVIDERGARLIELENWSALLELELKAAQSSRAVRLAAGSRRLLRELAAEHTYRGALARLVLKALRKARQGPRAFVTAAARRAKKSLRFQRVGKSLALPRASSIPAPTPRAGSRLSLVTYEKKPSTASIGNNPHVLLQLDDFDHGGLENVVLSLACGLRERGMKVSLLVLGKQGPAAEQARADRFRVITLPTSRRERHYERLLHQESVDLIQAHYSTFGAAITARAGRPFVQVAHNMYVWLDHESVDWYRRADQHTTATICVSSTVAQYCDTRMGLSAEKMIVIPNGVDAHRLEAVRDEPRHRLRDELGLSIQDFVFLNVASIHATKAQTSLVKAFAAVARVDSKARLVMVGSASDPAYERSLRRLILQTGLGRKVILAGQRGDVPRFYWMADTFVLPSFWEGWSLALTEAVLTGLPVVATDVGGARDLISPECGRLVAPAVSFVENERSRSLAEIVGDHNQPFIDRLADAMIRIRESAQRIPVPDERKRMLGVESMVDKHANVLGLLLQGKSAATARACLVKPENPTNANPEFVAA
jgi:glycosyltransferase involved in cell wall biosynthesis